MDFYNSTPEERARFYAQAAERVNQTDGYAKGSHVRITHIALGSAEGELEVCPEVLNPLGIVRCVTLNNTMNYFKPGREGKIYCKAQVEKAGRTVQVCQATLTNDQGEMVASGTFTFYALGPAE